MNLIKKMNEMEIPIQNGFYQFITRFFDTMEKYTDIATDVILHGFEDDIKFIQNEDDLINIIDKFCTINSNTIIHLNSTYDDKKRKLDFQQHTTKICSTYIDIMTCYIDKVMANECIPYMKSKKDLDLINKRRLFLLNKYNQTFITLTNELFEDFLNDVILFMKDYLLDIVANNESMENKNLNEIIEYIPEENIIIEETSTTTKVPKIKKIFNYKNLQNLALNNGYKYKWSSGDHNIFEHSITNKIIVIPSHTLGLGLSIKIQKQIYKNKEIV
jgi:predicted RNA binding protein YcfA (HicA-like mRNA interferase family)